MTISIVICAYNEARIIGNTIRSVFEMKKRLPIKQVIIVDDGSTDDTPRVLRRFGKKISHIRHSVNQGKGACLRDAFPHTTGDIVIIQDADGEYSPSDYPILIEPFTTHNADVVYGSRFIGNKPHRVLYFWHYAANVFLTLLSNMFTNLNLTDMETGFKVFRGSLIRTIAPTLVSNRFGFEPEITAKIAKIPALRLYEVGITYWGRTYDEGKKIRPVDGLVALWSIIRFNI